jgi:hypothetical protein
MKRSELLQILEQEIFRKRRERRIKKIQVAFEAYKNSLTPESSFFEKLKFWRW